MKRLLILAFIAVLAARTAAQDFEREARWRAEVVPNLVVGEAVDLRDPDGRPFLGLYVAVPGAKTAIVIVHGVGVHPDHGVIGVLRMALADRGFSTLSIQMPVLASDAAPAEYRRLFPLAARRIAAAAAWLGQRGDRDLVLVSHSMGSRMAKAYFDAAIPPAYRAWAVLGLGEDYSAAFAERRPLPVLDVLGSADLPAVLGHAPSRRKVAESTPGGRQRTIAGADHFYAGREAELVAAIAAFAAPPR
jgi:hypothetical protein